MQDALIGYTGFVGGALSRQHQFELLCNSANVSDLAGHRFGTVVCAAAPGSMVAANRAPDRDAAAVEALMTTLGSFRAERFVLISTIAVLGQADAGYDETTVDFERNLAYGHNRRRLETFCAEQFSHCLTLRLPALYGKDLRKNFLFDIRNLVPSMLNPAAWSRLQADLPTRFSEGLAAHYNWNSGIGMHVLDRAALAADPRRAEFEAVLAEHGMTALQFTNPASTFQYYGLDRLWDDVRLGLEGDLPLVHMATEPLKAADVYYHLTGKKMPESTAKLHREDFRTRHEDVFGGQNGYIQTRETVLSRLDRWMQQEQRR